MTSYTEDGNEFIENRLHEAGILPGEQSLYDAENRPRSSTT